MWVERRLGEGEVLSLGIFAVGCQLESAAVRAFSVSALLSGRTAEKLSTASRERRWLVGNTADGRQSGWMATTTDPVVGSYL